MSTATAEAPWVVVPDEDDEVFFLPGTLADFGLRLRLAREAFGRQQRDDGPWVGSLGTIRIKTNTPHTTPHRWDLLSLFQSFVRKSQHCQTNQQNLR